MLLMDAIHAKPRLSVTTVGAKSHLNYIVGLFYQKTTVRSFSNKDAQERPCILEQIKNTDNSLLMVDASYMSEPKQAGDKKGRPLPDIKSGLKNTSSQPVSSSKGHVGTNLNTGQSAASVLSRLVMIEEDSTALAHAAGAVRQQLVAALHTAKSACKWLEKDVGARQAEFSYIADTSDEAQQSRRAAEVINDWHTTPGLAWLEAAEDVARLRTAEHQVAQAVVTAEEGASGHQPEAIAMLGEENEQVSRPLHMDKEAAWQKASDEEVVRRFATAKSADMHDAAEAEAKLKAARSFYKVVKGEVAKQIALQKRAGSFKEGNVALRNVEHEAAREKEVEEQVAKRISQHEAALEKAVEAEVDKRMASLTELAKSGEEAARYKDFGITPKLFKSVKERSEKIKPDVDRLLQGSKDGNLRIVLEELLAGAYVDSPDSDGQTPLCLASANEREGVAGLLLEFGAYVDYAEEYGRTPFFVACKAGHAGVAGLLMECGANVEQKNQDGWTPMHTASRNGHKDVVELLLKKGAQLDKRNKEGETPLYLASEYGHEGVAGLLLESGANVDHARESGETPLMIASNRGHKGVVELLLKNGAQVHTRMKDGRTALALADNYTAIQALLRGRGARE